MARTHTFKGSGANYFAYIEDGQLVIGEDWGREGGILYKGPYQHAQIIMSKLRANAPKLANNIDKYYFDEAEKLKKISNVPAKEETITHQFKDSRDLHGYGYSGYIEKGQLVLCYEAPREGGVYYRGSYEGAGCELRNLKTHDSVLYNDIEKYFTKHGVKDESDRKDLGTTVTETQEELKKKYGFDETTKTILFKVRLYMDNRIYHDVLVRGRFQADVIKKLTPPVSEVLTLQTFAGEVFAVRSGKISAIEFLGD